jgi:hypothetical protein
MFDPVTKKGGWGFVIRDFAGDVIHAGVPVSCHMQCMHRGVRLLGSSESGGRSWYAEGDCRDGLHALEDGSGNGQFFPGTNRRSHPRNQGDRND